MRRLIILFIVLTIAIVGCTQKISERSLKEVEYALRDIRDAYDSRPQQYGDDVYTIEDAVKDTNIEQRILEDWDFEIVGNPPEKFVANSSSVNVLGTGKKVWYDVEEKAYHGFGIDK
jgi:outer membrane lipoprotein-sorting protein